MSPFLILFIGLLLIFVEFFLPGGVLAAIGALFLLLSIFVFAAEAHGPSELLLFIAGVAVSVILLIRFALRMTRRSASIYLESDQTGFKASEIDASMLGREGVALSDLKPSGHVMIEGVHYQALSQTSYLVKGTAIKVVGSQGAYLIVNPKEKS